MKRTLATMLVALALATPFASADVYTWIGSDDGTAADWTVLSNWEVGGITPLSAPDTAAVGDTVIFDVAAGKHYNVTDIPAGGYGTSNTNKVNFDLRGEGLLTFDSAGTLYIGGVFSQTGSVNLTMLDNFYPAGANTNVTTWNSTGTLTLVTGQYAMYFNQSDSDFRQQAGIVKMPGTSMFPRGGSSYYLEGGELQTTSLFSNGDRNNSGNSIDLTGGNLTQSGNMEISNTPVTLTDGVFTISGGKLTNGIQLDGTGLTTGATDRVGYIDFITGGTASFVTGNTAAEIEAYITAEGIRIDGAAANIGDFFITNDGSNTTVSLVPEPATMSLLALGGMAMLKRRKK